MDLNSRQKIILQNILENNKGLTQESLSCKHDVSKRTIRSDISQIRDSLDGNLVISYKSTDGYFIENYDENHARKLINNIYAEDGQIREKEERILCALQKIALSANYVKTSDLVDSLFLSPSAVSQVISDVEVILNQNSLKLERKRGYGVRIHGNEEVIRQFIVKYGLLDTTYFNVGNSFNAISSLYQDLDFYKVDRIIREEIGKSNLIIYQMFMNNLIIHVYLAVKRILVDCYIEIESSVQEGSPQIESIVSGISAQLEKTFQLVLPQAEKNYIRLQLVGKLSNNTVDYSENIDLYRWFMVNLARVDRQYGYHFIEDHELQRDLFTHLFSVYERIKANAFLRNPLIDDILNKYPLAFEIAVFYCSNEQSFLKIDNRDEIGYIAIHFAASMERSIYQRGFLEKKKILLVGTSGLGSAKLLEIKLLNYFKDRILIDILSPKRKLTKEIKDNYDLVISTLPLDENGILFVNSIPDDNELQKIATELFDKKSSPTIELNSIFREENFKIDNDMNDKMTIINEICSALFNNKIVDKCFVERVNERELMFNTAFGNSIAIPHPIEASSEISTVYTVINTEGVDWGDGQIVNVIFLLALRPEDTDKLSKLYDIFVHIIENATILFEIKKVNNYQSFIRLLEEINRVIG